MPTALAVIPHPDDESYSFAGTLALLARAGWTCEVVCASAGEGGERHDGGPQGAAALADARIAELRESCGLLGATLVDAWRLPDGGVRSDAVTPRLVAALERSSPDALLTLGADGAYGHPDHLAVYDAVVATTAAPGGPPLLLAAFPRGLFLPQYELCRDMMGDPPSPSPEAIGQDSFDLVVDIGAVAETKLAAIAAHRTQLPGGDPEALFPPGIVAELLSEERFSVRGELPASLLSALRG